MRRENKIYYLSIYSNYDKILILQSINYKKFEILLHILKQTKKKKYYSI